MEIRRRYIIALCVAVIAGVASSLIPHGPSGLDSEARAQQAIDALTRRHLPEAMAALERLTVPRDFRRITVGCRWYRCFVVPEPTAQVAPDLPGILRSIRGLNAQSRLLQARMLAVGGAVNEIEAPAYEHLHIAAPNPIGCTTAHNPREGTWTRCALPAVIADNVIAVFLETYLACHPGPCRWTDETEVDITSPSGTPGASQ